MAKEWREAFCPVCGTNHGQMNHTIPGKPWEVVSRESFWDRTELYNKDKPFGVVKSSEGRGTMKMVRYYDITEDQEGYFPQIKHRLLAALGEWVSKGWISREEVEEAIK